MGHSDPGPYRSGLGTLICALAAARTGPDLVAALWAGRAEACGAAAAGIVLADPDPRLLPGAGAMTLDPLLVAEFALSPVPLLFDSAGTLLDTYPVLGTVGAVPPDGACAVVPLSGPGTPPGALVATWERPRAFTAGDRGLLTALAGLCSAELARTWPADRERDALEALRRRLRPAWLPRVAGAELAVRHQPAEQGETGIGFYDVFATEDGVWRLVAGGVAGGGVDAAVLTGLARQAFRTPDPDGGPAAALSRLDRLVRDFGDPTCRMSAACVDLTRRGRGFTLTAARAGHPAPLVVRQSGAVLSVDVPGGPLGALADLAPAELGLELQPGDALLLRAGGPDRGPVADPRLAAVLTGCAGWSPSLLLDHVGLALSDRGAPATDGASFLALRVRGGRTRSASGSWLLA